MTRPDAYRGQLQTIQESAKFERHPDGQWQATPFPGFTVITPPWKDLGDSANEAFYTHLQRCQTHLLQQLPAGLLVPVPADSFHLTLADLIWDDAYRHANQDPAFELRLSERISDSFRQAQAGFRSDALPEWQTLGMLLMPRAIGVALVPNHEQAYDDVLALRRSIYQNPGLIALGIEQQYHFTAHITLGYFGDIAAARAAIADDFAEHLTEILTTLNESWLESDAIPTLQVHRAELRKFETMNAYTREPQWPVLEFCKTGAL